MRTLLLLPIAALGLTAASARPAAAQGCEPVDLVTYNTAFMVFPGAPPEYIEASARSRARQIARNVLETLPDVVALQEVFDDVARRTLVSMLGGSYPFRVEYVDGDGMIDPAGDSGLMLFSRLPFREVDGGLISGDVEAFADGQPWKQVSFVEFEEAVSSDWWANKGVAMVGIAGPCERHLVVAFTHLQASYPDSDPVEDAKVRTAQLADVERVFDSLSPAERARSELYLLGDLNVAAGSSEWGEHFDLGTPGAGLFKTEMLDSWFLASDSHDPALTEGPGLPRFDLPTSGHRFDYALRGDSTVWMPTCVQHLRVDRAIGVNARGEPLSDHLPVGISTHLAHRWCSPRTARIIPPPIENLFEEIEQQGMMQWFRVEAAGSYSIAVHDLGNDLGFDVYAESDLSRPLRPRGAQWTDRGWQYTMNGPFYVRVRGNSRTAHGEYMLQVHRNLGGDPSEAIELRPARALLGAIPSSPLNGENATWFYFSTEVSEGGRLPDLHVRVGADSWMAFDFELYELAPSLQRFDPGSVWSDVGGWREQHAGLNLAPGTYFVKVIPRQWVPPGAGFEVEYQTSLTYAVLVTLDCRTQDDGIGDDSVSLDATVDGIDPFPARLLLGDFDPEDEPYPLSALGTRRFASSLYLDAYDLDDGPSGDDVIGLSWISPLAPELTDDPVRSVRWNAFDSDYELVLSLSHEPPDYDSN